MAQETDFLLESQAYYIKNGLLITPTSFGDMLINIIDSKINTGSISTDVTLAANSNALIPTQKAVKTYAANTGQVQTARVVVPASQILTCYTTPVNILPAITYPTQFYQILGLYVQFNVFSGNQIPYTTNTAIGFSIGTATLTNPLDILGSVDIRIVRPPLFPSTRPPQGSSNPILYTDVTPTSANNNLRLFAYNGNPAGGGVPLVIDVVYRLIAR